MSVTSLDIKDVKIFLQRHCGRDESLIDPFLKKYKTSLPIETYLPFLQQFYDCYDQLKDTEVPISSWNPFAPKIAVTLCAEYIHQIILKKWFQHRLLWTLRAPSLNAGPVQSDIYLPHVRLSIDHTVWSVVFGDDYLLTLHDYLQKSVNHDPLFAVNYELTDLSLLSFTQKTQYFEHCFALQAQNPQYLYHDIEKSVLINWIVEWCERYQTYLPYEYGRESLRILWFNQMKLSFHEGKQIAQCFDPNDYYFLTEQQFNDKTMHWSKIFDDCLTTSTHIQLMKALNPHIHISNNVLHFHLENLFLHYAQTYAKEHPAHPIEHFLGPLNDSYLHILGRLPITFGATTPESLSRYSFRYMNSLATDKEKAEFIATLQEQYPLFMQWKDVLPLQDMHTSIAHIEQKMSIEPPLCEDTLLF